jgi:hypothetical protein
VEGDRSQTKEHTHYACTFPLTSQTGNPWTCTLASCFSSKSQMMRNPCPCLNLHQSHKSRPCTCYHPCPFYRPCPHLRLLRQQNLWSSFLLLLFPCQGNQMTSQVRLMFLDFLPPFPGPGPGPVPGVVRSGSIVGIGPCGPSVGVSTGAGEGSHVEGMSGIKGVG